jgi:hypothetical protein
VDLPEWLVGFQIALAMADDRVHQMIYQEYDAKVWNYTQQEVIPRDEDPALEPTSPEVAGANQGFDFGAIICDGLVLSPALFQAFILYADPLLDPEEEKAERNQPRKFDVDPEIMEATNAVVTSSSLSNGKQQSSDVQLTIQDDSEEELLRRLSELRLLTRERLNKLNAKIRDEADIY